MDASLEVMSLLVVVHTCHTTSMEESLVGRSGMVARQR